LYNTIYTDFFITWGDFFSPLQNIANSITKAHFLLDVNPIKWGDELGRE
jgi:hypothetical protein